MQKFLAVLAALTLSATMATAKTVSLEDLDDASVGSQIESSVPGFGSEGPVTLNWNPLNGPDTTLLSWPFSDFSGREGAYCIARVGCALDLTVAAGYTVTLESFFFGLYYRTDTPVLWEITDLARPTLVASDTPLVNNATGSVIAAGYTSSVGFRLIFSEDPNIPTVGLNDITYTYAKIDTGVAPVPLPASALLLAGGLAGLAHLRRRSAPRA